MGGDDVMTNCGILFRKTAWEHLNVCKSLHCPHPPAPLRQAQDMLLPTVGEGEQNRSKSLSRLWERDLG